MDLQPQKRIYYDQPGKKHQSKSNSKQKSEWLIILPFQFVILGSLKNDVYKTFGV